MSVPTSFLHTFPAAPVAPPSPLPFAPDPSVLQQDNLRVEYNLGELRRATRANLRTLIALETPTAPPRRQYLRHSPYTVLPAVPEGLRRRPGNPDSDIGRSLLFHTLDHPHTRRQVEDYFDAVSDERSQAAYTRMRLTDEARRRATRARIAAEATLLAANRAEIRARDMVEESLHLIALGHASFREAHGRPIQGGVLQPLDVPPVPLDIGQPPAPQPVPHSPSPRYVPQSLPPSPTGTPYHYTTPSSTPEPRSRHVTPWPDEVPIEQRRTWTRATEYEDWAARDDPPRGTADVPINVDEDEDEDVENRRV